MDAISLLKDDHKLVKKLFREFSDTTERAVKTRDRLSRRIVKELSVHAAIEEQILYPRLRTTLARGDEVVDHALDEHQEVKELLERIDGMSGDDPELESAVRELARAVNEHVKEEEGDVFKQLRAAAARKELSQWGEELKVAKKTAPTRPHPHVPNRPPASALVGTAAGAVDRVRDAATEAKR